ncbi:MAG: GNAT family N-acetyltransferase [Gaiellaceae bacterium]
MPLELRLLAEEGKVGAEAVRDGIRVGSLLGALVDDDLRGRHVWSALEDHGLAEGEDPELYRELYALAAEQWVGAGYLDHYVVVPAEPKVLETWYGLSFAQQQVYGSLRLVPALRPSPERFTVRLGGVDDLEVAMALAFVIFDHQAGPPTWAGAPAPPEDEVRVSYAEHLADPKVTYFVAEREGEPLGHLILERRSDTEVELSVAATVPEARGLGVGTALTDLALAWAYDQGFRTCVTDWRSANRLSARFWPRSGFRPTAYRLFRSVRLP